MNSRFIEIYDPKKRNEIIEENLRLRKKLKNRNEEDQNIKNEIQEQRVELFKPIIDSNEKIQNELRDDKNKIIDVLNNFEKLKIEHQIEEPLAIKSKKSTCQIVSKLIADYLKNSANRSNAGYSIKYDSEKNNYTIGNKVIEIDNNNLNINNKIYNATNGLLELMLKKAPNFTIINDDDIKNYFQILKDSNGVYQGFDTNSKRLNSDSSEKWKFIKDNFFSKNNISTSSKTGGLIGQQNIQILPSNPNSLLEMLQLSTASYQAGNENEYNKINSILDELLRLKIIKKRQLKMIYKNIN